AGYELLHPFHFVAVGPARTATTWLHEILGPHANLPARVKETRFFDRFYDYGPRWYRSQFGAMIPARPVGELAPTYFPSRRARELTRFHAPAAKVICSLRDPIDRLYSLFRYKTFHGTYRWDFEYAVGHDPEMLESSRYGTQTASWIRDF